MPEVTQCPQCQRKLNVQETQLGQTVQCPVCGAFFTAAVVGVQQRPATPPPVPEDREPPPRRDDDRPRRYRDDDRPRRPLRRGYDDDRDPYSGGRPHRGGAVLALGLIGLLLSCIPLAGWILGGIAVSMANNDLAAMNRGMMDDSGRGMTQGGQVCGTIALVLATLVFFGACLIRLSALK